MQINTTENRDALAAVKEGTKIERQWILHPRHVITVVR